STPEAKFPLELELLMAELLAKNPEKRPASALEVRSRLQQLRGASMTSPAAPHMAAPPLGTLSMGVPQQLAAEVKLRQRRRVAVAASAVIALLAAAGWLATREPTASVMIPAPAAVP